MTQEGLVQRERRMRRAGLATERFKAEFFGWTTEGSDFLLRGGYVSRDTSGALDLASDRRSLPRSDRPPAGQLITSQGAALRLHLTMLAAHQGWQFVGSTFRNDLPCRGRMDSGGVSGWTDVVAISAGGAGSEIDRAERSIRSALVTMEKAHLVDLRRDNRRSVRQIQLLDERGGLDNQERYRIPDPSVEETLAIPLGMFTCGWVHLLEDSELALLLAVFRQERLSRHTLADGTTTLPEAERAWNYGISRDSYSTAWPVLAAAGLIDVIAEQRHLDGKSVDDNRRLHRLRINREALRASAFDRIQEIIDAPELIVQAKRKAYEPPAPQNRELY